MLLILVGSTQTRLHRDAYVPKSCLILEQKGTFGVWGLCCSTPDRAFLALRGPGSVRAVNLSAARAGLQCLELDPYRCEDPNGFVRGLCFIPEEVEVEGACAGAVVSSSCGRGTLLLCTTELVGERAGEWLVSIACEPSAAAREAWPVTHRIPSMDRGGPVFFSALGPDRHSSGGGTLILCAESNARFLQLLRLANRRQIVQVSRIPMPDGGRSFIARADYHTTIGNHQEYQLLTFHGNETVRLYRLKLEQPHELSKLCEIQLTNPYRAMWIGYRIFVSYRPATSECHSVVELRLEQSPAKPRENGQQNLSQCSIFNLIQTPTNLTDRVINEWCSVGHTSLAIHDMTSRGLYIYSVIE